MGKFKHQIMSIILVTHVSACAHNVYIAPQNDSLADISFSSLMPGSSVILLRTNCRNYLIGESSIEPRKPTTVSKNYTAFRAGVAVKFRYEHIDTGGIWLNVSPSSFPGAPIVLEEKRAVHACSDEVIFIPEGNKRYEVYIGTDSYLCHIFVKEVQGVDTYGNKTLIDVDSSSATVC